MPIRAVMPIRDIRNVRPRIARRVSADRKAGFGTLRAGRGTLFLRRCTQGPRGSANPAHPGDDRADGARSAAQTASAAAAEALRGRARAPGDRPRSSGPAPWKARARHPRRPARAMIRTRARIGAR